MRMTRLALPSALTLAFLVATPPLLASELTPQAVTFAPGYESTFTKAYGAEEVPALRTQVVRSVAQSLKSTGASCTLGLDVTIERAAPTHPTMHQQLGNPSLDPVHTVFRDSGAALVGHVLDANGRVLATVKYDYFNGYQASLTPARDPWSEARVAIDTFSHRLVRACSKQTAPAGS